MPWSTRRLADLAGTTVKTVRHYHSIDLLEEPERAPNGYKLYGTRHLVRLLQISRLRGLGMSLAQIAEVEDSADDFSDTVRALDAQLAASIEHQQAIRAELADLLRHRPESDVPAGFGAVAENLSSADRAIITVTSQLFGAELVDVMRDMAASHVDLDAEFNALRADADDEAVRSVARRLAPVLRSIREDYPAARDPRHLAIGGEAAAMGAVTQALADLYNPAQLRVMQQAHQILEDDDPSRQG